MDSSKWILGQGFRLVKEAGGTARAVTAVVSAAMLFFFTPAAGAFEKVKVGEKIPEFSLSDTSGNTVSSADLAGKAQVIVFFRKGPNTRNALKRIERSHQANQGKEVLYLGLYLGKGSADDAKAMAEEGGVSFPILMGTKETYSAFGVKALPTTAFVDKEGVLIHEVHLAPFDLEQEANEYILVALGEKTKEEAEMTLRPQEAQALSEEERQAKKLYGLAMVLMERGMKEKAVDKLKKILELDPGFCEAHILLGNTYLEDDQIEDAIGEFTYVIKCDPNSNDAKLGLGMAYAKKEELEKAVEYFQGALKLNPKPERVYYELGKVYEKKGDLAQAVESYKLALQRLLGHQ